MDYEELVGLAVAAREAAEERRHEDARVLLSRLTEQAQMLAQQESHKAEALEAYLSA